ncbi:hypothetical protein LBMAG56_16620 [Verrucomicrobiota bacterium]|nr:hypothetical protein LBMAG56_16620 [Verrucomicrobiota bacterium]
MNSHQENLELARRYLDGTATPEETRALEELLRTDSAFRRQYLRYTNVDAALGSGRLSAAPAVQPAQVVYHPSWFGWFQWRPLAAAAAGLVIGLFSASVVFGIVVQRGVERRTPLAVFEPGFENPQMPLAVGFPAGSGRWSGDAARVVTAENGVPPKEGKFMLRLEPMSKGVPRIYQVLDLQSVPSSGGSETRNIEISASFAAAGDDATVRYVIRAFAVSETPASLDAAWFDRRDESIASATRGLDVMPGTKGWLTLSVKIQVPRAARSLVLFLGTRTPDKAARTAPHYLDDVRVALLTSPAVP